VLIDHIKHNITLANLGRGARGVIDERRERKVANEVPQEDLASARSGVYQNGQPVGRQPAEGGAVEVAVLRSPRC
jgi:hypothetical protein